MCALDSLGAGLAQLRFLCGALIRKTARLRFVFRVRLFLRLACGFDLRIARVHKGQHRLEEQLF